MHTFTWKAGQNSVNILFRATRNGHPRSTSTDRIEKMVIPQEAHKCNGRKVERTFVRACTPYCCCYWHEVVVFESLRISFSIKVLPYTFFADIWSTFLDVGSSWVILTFVFKG